MLPAELGTTELSISKFRPQSLLGVGLVVTQLSCFDPNVFMPLLSPKNSLTLALSLLEGEGISWL
jgi:hypothetical protein